MSSVIIGAVMALVGVLGAYLFSRAIDLGMATYGLGLVVFAIFFGFWLIKDHFDQAERR